jgi:hypothetical protein
MVGGKYLTWYDIIVGMTKNHGKPRKNHLALTRHARQRLSERGLWPALGHIARIAHHPASPRYADRSSSGRPVERIELDGVCVIVARDSRRRELTLLTVHSGNEIGARACQRIASLSQGLGRSLSG